MTGSASSSASSSLSSSSSSSSSTTTILHPHCSIQLTRGKGMPSSSSSSFSSFLGSDFDTDTDTDSFDYNDEETIVAMKGEEEEVDEDDEDERQYHRNREESIVYIQKMNNICANSIKIGKYNMAIVKLGEALKLLINDLEEEEEDSDDDDTALASRSTQPRRSSSSSHSYLLDECLDYSEQPSYHIKELELRNNGFGQNYNEKPDTSVFHNKPIRIPKKHCYALSLSSTLLVSIITFNLALAQHLAVLKEARASNKIGHTSSALASLVLKIKNTIRFYGLLLQSTTIAARHSGTTTSERYNTILRTNLEHMKTQLVQKKKERFNDILQLNLDRMTKKKTITEDDYTTKKNVNSTPSSVLHRFIVKNDIEDTKKVSSRNEASSSSSLYEQHKALLRKKYDAAATISKTEESSSTIHCDAVGNNTNNDDDNTRLKTKLRDAMRTASSFVHLQQHQKKNVQGAHAA